jgi:hypothetical protein
MMEKPGRTQDIELQPSSRWNAASTEGVADPVGLRGGSEWSGISFILLGESLITCPLNHTKYCS